jgi:hypothetical protein
MNQESAHFVTDVTDKSPFLTLSSVLSVTDRALFEKYAAQLKQIKSPPTLSKPQERRLRALIEAVCEQHQVAGMLEAALPHGIAAIELYEQIKADHELGDIEAITGDNRHDS